MRCYAFRMLWRIVMPKKEYRKSHSVSNVSIKGITINDIANNFCPGIIDICTCSTSIMYIFYLLFEIITFICLAVGVTDFHLNFKDQCIDLNLWLRPDTLTFAKCHKHFWFDLILLIGFWLFEVADGIDITLME